MSRVMEYIASEPWAITPEALYTILEVAARENRPVEAIERDLGRPLQNTRKVRVRDGVAVIPISGPLFRYGNLFTRISGATSYEDLASDIGQALASPDVFGIVFDVDSPGGQVNGALETAELIFRAREEKPTAAVFSGTGASAAYLIGSAAQRTVVSPMAMVGSVGAVLGVKDTSALEKAQGVQSIEFVSSQSPKKRLDPFAEDEEQRIEARTELQTMVDSLAQVFIDTVAKYRGVGVEDVLSDFGQGGVLVGQQAHAAGMVDGVGTLEEIITEMQRRHGARAAHRPAAGITPGPRHGRMTMADEKKPAADVPVVDRAFLEANHPELLAEIRAEARAEGLAEGCMKERDRILGIQALHGPAEVRAECVKDSSVSVGDAAVRMNAAQKAADEARASAHLKDRADAEKGLQAPKPSVTADNGASDERMEAKRIVALHHQLQGRQKALSA